MVARGVAAREPRYTKVIATLGPATRRPEDMRALLSAGVDCFRLNFSHGDGEAMAPLIDTARQAARQLGMPLTLLGDIQGPKIRIGTLPGEGVVLRRDRPFIVTRRKVPGDETAVHVPYPHLVDDLEPGARLLFADGVIELVVERIDGDDVHTRITAGGTLFSRKGLNMPGRALSIETLTDKDRRDLAFVAQADIDIVAISFVRSPDDLRLARECLGGAGTPLMAKLERPEALGKLDEILDASDGVMVARGDLGVELPFEQVPVLQKRILERARQRGKWAVVATQMLGSMVEHPRPSRAEASDVVNAVIDGADALMLSEETAVGRHPVAAVEAMNALTREAERLGHSAARHVDEDRMEADIVSFAAGAAGAAVAAAERMNAAAIVTLAGSRLTALLVSKRGAARPIVALASRGATLNRLNVLRGVVPVEIADATEPEAQLQAADGFLVAAGWATPGEIVVVVAAVPLGTGKETNTIRFHRVRAQDSTGPKSTFPDE